MQVERKAVSVVKEVEWDAVIERLKYHRQRLNLDKSDVIDYIKDKYGKTFYQLTDSQVMELGKTLANCDTKGDFMELLEE